MTQTKKLLKELGEEWMQKWPEALRTWSKYINLRDPTIYLTQKEAIEHGVIDTFAQISMADLGTMINIELIHDYGLEDYPLPVLCHEIGHHILAPGNLRDLALMVALIKPIFGDNERAIFMENLFTDLIVNDTLYSTRNLPMDQVYKKMTEHSGIESRLWVLYLRVYETLWRLPKGALIGSTDMIDERLDFDAGMVAKIIRIFGKSPFRALKKIAYIFLPYFPSASELNNGKIPHFDSELAGKIDPDKIGSLVYGMSEISDDESRANSEGELDAYNLNEKNTPGSAQTRSPAEIYRIYNALGLELPIDSLVVQYYRNLAMPHLVEFPREIRPEKGFELEGTDRWEFGDSFSELSWIDSLLESPVIIPNLTTRKRLYSEDEGDENAQAPLWLDLYIDCSGSMPNPKFSLSYLSLAGTIMALSALQAGAKVQVTLWSDYGKWLSSRDNTKGGPLDGFLDNEDDVLALVTNFINGITGFPLNILRETYVNFPEDGPRVHIMSISDSGIDTLLDKDEQGTPGEKIARMALGKAKGGGTQVLNIWGSYKDYPALLAIEKLGFDIHAVSDWKSLVEFAEDFVNKKYGSRKQDES